MSAWLLTILGITVIGVLVELLLTDSPMSKFVRSIYAFFILFVIVQPIPGLLKNASAYVSTSAGLDTGLLQTINENSRAAFERSTHRALVTAGFTNAIVTIEHNKTASSFKIERVYVNAWNTKESEVNKIIEIVSSICSVSKDKVEVFI